MKAIQAIKKMVALGMGLTMVGATIFGASAAKLSDYPAPFIVNGTPASNLAIIVGDAADGSDVVGAIDIIQSLQTKAVVKTAAVGAPSQLVVEGDAVEIGSTSDLLEINEAIGNVRETLTEVDLDMLKGGQIVTDEGSTEFNQYLRFPNDTGFVAFGKDERDRVGYGLFYNDGSIIFQWELEFEEGLQSKVELNDLDDLEDEDITILGQPFVIVDTDLSVLNFGTVCNGTMVTTVASCIPRLTFDLIGGAVSAVLGENDKETYVVDGKEYEVEVLVISETSADGEGSVKFRINGEITDELLDGETDVLADGTQVGIRDIMATGKDIQKSVVQFYLGAYKVQLMDENTSDQLFTQSGAEVNEETIEDSFVRIRGQFMRNAPSLTTLTGSEFEIQSVQYNLTADAVLGDMYVGPGTGVRAQLSEPEGMLTPNWDIRCEGLMDTGVTLVRIDAAGNDEYDMEFTNQEGIFFDFPLVSNELGNSAGMFKYGDNDNDLWFEEFCILGAPACAPFTTANTLLIGNFDFYISDDDFFVVSNCNVAAAKNTCFSHVLRYDNIDVTNRQLTFTDLGTGTREVSYDSATFMAELVVGGVTYRVGVDLGPLIVGAPGVGNILIDLNADGAIVNCTEAIIGIQGEGLIDLGAEATPIPIPNNSSVPTNETVCPNAAIQTWANVTLRTLQKEFDEAGVDELIQINVTWRMNHEVGINDVLALSGIYFSNLVDLEENNDIEQALSGYGVFFELFNPQNGEEAEDLTIEYPLSQRGARVFVTGGVVSTTSIAGGGVERVQPIQIGAAKLATEVSDVSMYNAIVVGGPCANPIAATLLGNPEPCYESVGQNEAIVKLFEHSNGNVALLVNGRTALNTRMGARAIATGEIIKAASKEAKVTGPKLTEITVSAV